tara:strand:- start:40248 stop:40766 length:519 start_codon:yes stop_codon:yes gene_type:complete
MSWEMWVIATIAFLSGLSGLVMIVLALPGIWFMVLCAGVCWWWQPGIISGKAVITLAIIGIVSEAMEIVASAAGAKKFGGSKRGAMGAIVGTMLGALFGTVFIPIPILGTILGGILGAGAGALMVERSIVQMTWKDSMKSGSGAAIGRTISIFIKIGLAIGAGLFFVIAAFV